MKMTVEFNSFQELDDFINGVAIAPALLQLEADAKPTEEVKAEKPKKEKSKKADEVKEEPKAEEGPKTEDIMPAPQEEAPKADAPKVAIEDVRALLGKLQKAGKKEEVKELIASFGVDKLSQIKEEDYPSLMEKAGALDA